MLRATRPFVLGFGVSLAIGLGLGVLSLLLWPDLLQNLFASNFVPHAQCYLLDPNLVSLHGFSDTTIGFSYVGISMTLVYFVYKTRRDIPFQWIFLAFGLFIIACGSTHFMEVWTLWSANYWLSGGLKLITAVASLGTALALPPLLPQVFHLIKITKLSEERKVKLEEANRELEVLYHKSQELDRLKTQFFANVSHELRTPLTLILGPTRQMLATNELNLKQRYNLEIVERNAGTLLKQVNDLLDFSRLEAGKLELNRTEVNLAQLVQFIASHFDLLARERRINFVVETPASLPTEVDSEKIQRVLLNLLSNAFKFTPDGGTIGCILNSESDRATLTVQDNGPGIPPKMREAIFERFRQIESGTNRRYSGTGLGLSIVKEFVELHSGKVSVSETPGGGASFRVELPLHRANPPENLVHSNIAELVVTNLTTEMIRPVVEQLRPDVTPARSIEPLSAEKPLILVVEDNPQMSRFLTEALSTDYQVAAAFDGEAGLDKALELQPDLILTDVIMPRMSGDLLVQTLRTKPNFENVPVVLLSARTDEALRVELLRKGAQDYLIKPFSAEELKARLDNLLKMRQTRQVLQNALASQNHDITQLADELALRKHELEQAVSARDEFLAVAAHELKTPLTSLRGYAQFVINKAEKGDNITPDQLSRAMQAIDRQSDKLGQLVGQLLNVARLQIGQLVLEKEKVNLVELVENVVASARLNKPNHPVELSAPKSLTALVDPLRLEQVVNNLLDNALKFSPDEKSVQVVLSLENSGKIYLSVTDQGIGIAPEYREHIFERFYQAHTREYYGGMGLGLYITKQIVELHGGTIYAEFPPGGGTRFIVYLPPGLNPDANETQGDT